ncbi:hypothetical protein IIE18_14165 [Pseudomonas sp. V1]|uniref:hypothetical protein n=1 Tax=Pseudomonas arcuscaelestis TaxID=2710591 RepID=UPI00193EF945|nr:hypothetical protein [Pseudomonas arcuscaelestis]MBM3106280.1 hypothetical protein [Pseudomonas arcuscaelestis]
MLFKIDKNLKLPPQLQWKFGHEAQLMEWTIQARNYNTLVANLMFGGVTILLCVISITMYSVYEGMGQPWRTLSCIVFFTIMLAVTSSMTHQRFNCAYRFTKSGVEHCEWKDFPAWAPTCIKWMIGTSAIIFIFMATIDMTFLIGALVGPGGMGLMYVSMANSKNYRELHTQYHHYAYKWKEITQLAIATNREIVDLKYSVTQKGDNYKTNWNLNIYCKRNQKENVAAFIKTHLSPDVPFIRAKVNVPLSTDY